MMYTITDQISLEQLYHYQLRMQTPYFFPVDFDAWKTSFTADTDGEGRTLFRELTVKAAFEGETLVGFIQYGRTAIGFDQNGEVSGAVSYPVIRNLYVDENHPQAGELLLREALAAFGSAQRVYAFFHYFGMSCFARHGKLFEKHAHMEALLKQHGFETEHENVYYSSHLTEAEESEVTLVPHGLTAGNQQYLEFLLDGASVGGCEVHYVDSQTAYLRWIFVQDRLTGRGIGTQCMQALKGYLLAKGIRRFDTDTALSNLVAQHYYEKNRFTREGITRSYFTV